MLGAWQQDKTHGHGLISTRQTTETFCILYYSYTHPFIYAGEKYLAHGALRRCWTPLSTYVGKHCLKKETHHHGFRVSGS